MQDQKLTSQLSPNRDSMMDFQISEVPISQKESKETGLAMSKKIWGYVTTGFGGYIYNRNIRFLKYRSFANGTIDVESMFRDRFQFNSKQNYIRLVWNTLQITNRIISGLVGRWMSREEKIVVEAMDDQSIKDKQDQYEQILFVIENRKQLEQLQAASGVQMMPQDDSIPADKEELLLWKQEFQRIPEEIENELACNEVLINNSWFSVLKDKMLHDSAEVGLVGTYTWLDEQGVIHVDWVKPENMIYSATDYPDFRDCTWLGEVPDMKISTLRRMYGKEFHPNDPLALTEEQIFTIAQSAKEYKSVTNLNWDFNNIWNTSWLRPYDEWNIRCVKFEVRTVDSEPYTVTTTKSTGTTYTQRGYPTTASGNRRKPSDNQKVIDDSNINIYRGVYLPDTETLLEWGLKKNMIRPQDPKEIGNAEFSYSFFMPQNYQMLNLSIPAKIEAAVDNMMLACLKMQQVIARMRPTGAAINEDALQEVDFGLGDDANKTVDRKRLYDQTGDIYYRGRDAEGNPIPVPITELANSGFLGQMEGLIKDYQFWYQTLKDELGEDPNLISQALQPRVTSGNVDAAQQSANNATDYYYNAYVECMKMTARKVSCLLKDSITWGAKAYRTLVKQDDIADRIFTTDIKLLPTEQQIAQYDAMLQNALMSTPELAMFINQLQAMEIVKRDVKLGWIYYNQCTKKMLLWKQQQAAQNAQLNAQAQQDSLAMKAQFDMKQLQTELQMKGDLEDRQSKNKMMETIVNGIMQIMAKGIDVQPEWKPVEQEIINYTLLPLFSQNLQNVGALGGAIQEQQRKIAEQQAMQQAAAQQQAQEEQQEQPQQNQSQPMQQAMA